MGASSEILYALNGKLNTITGADIAWPNTAYNPNPNTLYLRPTHLPVLPTQIGLADSDRMRRDGFYQVDVFAPRNVGESAAMTIAESIFTLFSKGLELQTSSGYVIKIISSVVEGGQVVGSHFAVPVLIQYVAITP